MELAELVCGGLARWQHHDEVLLVVAGGGELDVVEAEPSRGQVLVSLAVVAESRSSVFLPEIGA